MKPELPPPPKGYFTYAPEDVIPIRDAAYEAGLKDAPEGHVVLPIELNAGMADAFRWCDQNSIESIKRAYAQLIASGKCEVCGYDGIRYEARAFLAEPEAAPACPECHTAMCDMREVTAPTYACCNPDCSQPKTDLCEGCPPVDYPTQETRCLPCPRRLKQSDTAPQSPAAPERRSVESAAAYAQGRRDCAEAVVALLKRDHL